MKHLILCIVLATSASARAEPWRLGAHLASAHARGGYEAATVGVYARAPDGLTLGLLRNSERRASLYLAHTWETRDQRWALSAGVITGYRGAAVSPLVVPSLRLPLPGQGAAALRLSLIPKARAGGSSALHLSAEGDF
ncbi:UNVERIFIED_ORG: hypothetical protein LHJ69_12930 [Shinella sp. XGS7]|nr:hypothetical protein [Shinella sp. XGS7]